MCLPRGMRCTHRRLRVAVLRPAQDRHGGALRVLPRVRPAAAVRALLCVTPN